VVPKCRGCGKTPDQIKEYVSIAEDEDMSPEEYVRRELSARAVSGSVGRG
jgi:hypothetical protein